MSQELILDPYIDHFPKNAQKSEPLKSISLYKDTIGMIVVDVNGYRLNQQRLQSVFRADTLLWISQRQNWDFSIQKISLRNSDFYPKRKTASSKYQVSEIIR